MSIPRQKGGRFAKGNNTATNKTLPEIKLMRDITRDKLIKMAYHLAVDSKAELLKRLKTNDHTTLEYFTANSVSKNNSKFIQWLFDQAVGRPRQVDVDNAQRPIEIKLSYDPSSNGQAVASVPIEEIKQ